MGSKDSWLTAETKLSDTLALSETEDPGSVTALTCEIAANLLAFYPTLKLELQMSVTSINRLRLTGFVAACVTAVVSLMQGDTTTAAGIIAAALSAPGLRTG